MTSEHPVTDGPGGAHTVPDPVTGEADIGAPAPDGIDVDQVSAWFAANIPDVAPPLSFRLIAGGRSNLTFEVGDAAGRRSVLRRPPTGHVLPTAHDMAREHRIIAALGPAGIPVPRTLGLCVDAAVTGAPFYVMTFVDGVVPRSAEEAEAALDVDGRRRAGLELVDTLAAIHAVDPDAVGLGDLGRREGYVARQLRRWQGQYESTRDDQGGLSVPDLEVVHDLLVARIPEQGQATVVHGDYRLDNAVFDGDGHLLAVLDWELCTLGDPLADVAQLLVYWSEPGEPTALGYSTSTAPGFPTRSEVVDRYVASSGRAVGALDFYLAFASWRLGCVLVGVHARYQAGTMGDTGFDHGIYPERIRHLAGQARSFAARLG